VIAGPLVHIDLDAPGGASADDGRRSNR